MYTQNFSQNSDDQSGQADQDKSRSRNDIQREIVMQESDLRKKLAEKTQLEMEIRALKKENARLKATMQEKQIHLEKIDQDIFQMDAELKSIKKKLNLL